MPDQNTFYNVRLDDGREEQWNQEQYDKLEKNLYEKYPNAEVMRVSAYNPETDTETDDMDSFQVYTPDGRTETWNKQQLDNLYGKLVEKYPTAKVARIRPFGALYDKAQNEASHVAAMQDLYKEGGDDWRTEAGMEQVARLRKRMQDLRGQVENYDKKMSDELGQIPGQQARVIRQSQLEPTRADLRKQYEEAANAYYNDPYVIEENKRGASRAGEANEELEELIAPIKKERQERNEKRSPYLVGAAAGIGGNAAVPTWDEMLYRSAKNLNDDTIRIYEAPSKFGKEPGAQNFLKGAWDRVSTTDFWTMGLTGIADQYALNEVLKKVRDEIGGIQDITEEKIEKKLTPMEKQVLSAFLRNAEAQSARAEDLSAGYQAGQSAADSLQFMAQFILSGGLTAGLVEGVTGEAVESMSKWIAKSLGKAGKKVLSKAGVSLAGNAGKVASTLGSGFARLAGDAIQTVFTAPLQPGMYKNILEMKNTLDDNGELVDQKAAAWKGVFDYAIEVGSESMGDYLGNVLGAGVKAIPGSNELFKKLGQTKFGKIGKAFYNSAQLRGLRAGGWHNGFGEMEEEFIGAALRTLTGLDPDAWKEQWKGENIGIMALSFLPMTVYGGVMNTAKYGYVQNDFAMKKSDMRTRLETLGFTPEKIDYILDSSRMTSPEDAMKVIMPAVKEMRKKGATKEDTDALAAYAIAGAKLGVYDGFEGEKVAEERQETLNTLQSAYGDFWQDAEDGEKFVRTISMPNGQSGYVKNTDRATGEIMFIDKSDGKIHYTNGKINGVNVSMETLDQYLDRTNLEKKTVADEARMSEEAEAAQNEFNQKVQEDADVPIGPNEAQTTGKLVMTDDGMGNRIPARDEKTGDYLVETEDGVISVSRDDLASKWGIQLNPKSQEQLDAEELAEYTATKERIDTYNKIKPGTVVKASLEGMEDKPVDYKFLRAQYDEGTGGISIVVEDPEDTENNGEKFVPESAFPGLSQTAAEMGQRKEDAAEKVVEEEGAPKVQNDFRGKPLPLKDDGTVNGNKLWDEDKEAWCAWNDDKRKDGGANSINYINLIKSKLEAEKSALQDKYGQEADQDERDKIEAAVSELDGKISELNDLLLGYTERADAAKKAAEQAKKAAEEAAKVEADAETAAPVEAAENAQENAQPQEEQQISPEQAEEQRRAPLRERAHEWEAKTGVEVELIENAEDIPEQAAADAYKEGEVIKGWYDAKTGKVYIFVPNMLDEADVDKTYIHEVISHKGLKEMLGAFYPSLLDRVWRDVMDDKARRRFTAYVKKTSPNASGRDLQRAAADEFIADLSENLDLEENKTAWDKFVLAVRQLIIEIIMGKTTLTKDDLADLLRASMSRYRDIVEKGEAQPLMRRKARAEMAKFSEEVNKPTGQKEAGVGSEVRFSITQEDNLKKAAEAFHKKLAEKPLTEEELRAGNDAIDWMVAYMRPYLDLAKDGKRYMPEEVFGKEWSTIFENGSYGRTMENTLLCMRTLAYNDFVNAVQEKIGRPLTVTESFLASQMLYDIATDPQCLYCYVALDRKAYNAFLKTYIEQRDAVLDKYKADDSIDKSYRLPEQSKSKKERTKLPDDNPVNKLYNEYLNGREDSPVQRQRFNSWLDDVAEGTLIKMSDLTSPEKRQKVALQGESYARQIEDAERYAQAASWAKKQEEYRAYNGELLKMPQSVVDMLNSEYGLRFYSFSEYTPAFIVENMQMVRDAALRNLIGLAYTKEVDFAKIFAPTGVNINISVYGREAEDGTVVMDTKQGADWTEASALREKYGNVGVVFVATNDKMVEWAINQPWIDCVIPFHIVRTGENVAAFYDWTNYTSMEGEKDSAKHTKYLLPTEHKNDKATFLALCEERGLKPRFADLILPSTGRSVVESPNYMKLVNETRRSVEETERIKPVFDLDAARESFDRFVEKGGYYGGWFVEEGAFEKGVDQVASDVLAGKTAKEVDYGRQDIKMSADKLAEMATKRTRPRTHQGTPLTAAEKQRGEKALGDILAAIGKNAEQKEGGETRFRISNDELFDKAKERFGTTRDLREAGYILPDGTLLDFSGRHMVEGDGSFLNGRRSVDHRDIADLNYERDLNTPTGIDTDMVDFINRGAVRIDGDSGSINLAMKPTDAQMSVIRRIVERTRGEAYIDFGADNTDHYAEYDGARPDRVVNDIKRYFDEGYKPEGNISFGEIRFKIGEENINAGLDALDQIASGKEVVKDAMSRPDLSQYGADENVTFYWGEPGIPEKGYKKGYGIAHMGAKHGAESILRALEIIDHGDIDRYVDGNKTVVLTDGEYEALLALTRNGQRETWLFNGWKKKENADETSEVGTQSGSTQTNPTFSREDLGAAVSEYKDRVNSEKTNKKDENVFSEELVNAPENAEESVIRFRKVEDPAKIEELENGEKELGYRNVVMNEDGTLGSPMAGRLGKKGEKSVSTSGFAFNEWEEAEENPNMATEDGKINLIKPGGKGSVDGVDYNPYIHIRPTTVNKQFTQAWKRPELVYVETAYPTSELTSGYKADKAKLSVGRHAWNGGELILSRYDKPMRVVPWDEVADAWEKEFGNGVTFDIVPPALLPILDERGVKILAPKKAAGDAAMQAYKDWRKENPTEAQKKAIEFVTGKKSEDNGIRFSIRGIVGAHNDKLANENLEIAKEMSEKGVDPMSIWRATGWEKGADGKWRNEIPDAKLKDGVSLKKSNRAGDILDAPELLESYPQLQDISIDLEKMKNAGAYRNNERKIALSRDYNTYVDEDGRRVLSPEGGRTLLHELQHAIQHIEGFAKGGSEKTTQKDYLLDVMQKDPALGAMAVFFASSNPTNVLINNRAGVQMGIRNSDMSRFAPIEQDAMRKLDEYLTDLYYDDYAKFVRKAKRVYNQSKKNGSDGYEKLAGEVEARNVEFRSRMTDEKRKDFSPMATESVPRNEQILRFRMSNANQEIPLSASEGVIRKDQVVRMEEANAQQKLPVREEMNQEMARLEEPEIMFRLSNNNRATIESWLKKRTDITDEQREAVVNYIDGLEDSKTQLATGRWYANGSIRLPEDMDKVKQAVSVAGKAKVDPLQYDNPMSLLEAHANFKPTAERINPDTVSTLHKSAEYPEGVVVYDVDESEESRKNMRQIINTHFGADASPWCLLQGDGKGNLTANSKKYWKHYNAYPKQVAFKDGKLLAFSANDSGTKVWWDRQDTSHYGIPITKKIDGDELGRSAMHIFNEDGELIVEPGTHLFKGNRQNGVYEEWSADGETLLERTHYKDGVENGLCETWYPNGQKRSESNQKDGAFVGAVRYWWDNGYPRVFLTVDEQGRKEGVAYEWYRNGVKRWERNWKAGNPAGTQKHWDTEGVLDEIWRNNNEGDLISIDKLQKYPSGTVVERTSFTSPLGQMHVETIMADNLGEPNQEIPAFEKVKRNQPTMFRIANANQRIFISNAENALGKIKMEKATPEQWKKMLEKEGGLKAAEDKWLGLSQWLDAQTKKTLTKDEVGQFIAENQIQIEETHYAEDIENDETKALQSYQDEIDEILANNGGDIDAAWQEMIERYGDDFEMAFEFFVNPDRSIVLSPITDWNDSLVDAAKYFLDQRRERTEERINTTRKHYTTEGLTNLHEIALTVPTIEPWNEDDQIHFGDAGEGRAISWARFGDTTVSSARDEAENEVKEAEQRWKEYREQLLSKYYELNPATNNYVKVEEIPAEEDARMRELYHEYLAKKDEVRKTAYPREKVLVIDEIQSKRHQEGREKGYVSDELKKLEKEYDEFVEETAKKHNVEVDALDDVATPEEKQHAADYNNRISELRKQGGVPAAPFEKNWPELTMKRMLRYAAEFGYDTVAWTTGEQQAERYNIGNIVDSIKVFVDGEKRDFDLAMAGESTIRVFVDENGVVTGCRKPEFVGKNLGEIFGKEIAARIMSAENGEEITGEGLRVGGEGMKGFYDDILVRWMNKYAKQWGVKVEDIRLPYLGADAAAGIAKGLTMHSVPITEEMKSSVMEGQLMFRIDDRKEDESAHDFLVRAKEGFESEYKSLVPIEISDDQDQGSAEYDPMAKKITIFALNDLKSYLEVENSAFHENFHAFVDEMSEGDREPFIYGFLAAVTRYIDPKEYEEFRDDIFAEYDEDDYDDADRYEEVAANLFASLLQSGNAAYYLPEFDGGVRKKFENLINRLGYEPRREAESRKIVADVQDSVQEQEMRDSKAPEAAEGAGNREAWDGGKLFRITSAQDLVDRYENQDGEEYPWMSQGELLRAVEENIERDDATDHLFELLDRYHDLEEENFAEGKRDFAGGEMDDLFNEILDELRNLEPVETEEAETKFKIGDPVVIPGPTAEELITKVQNSGLPGILEKDEVDDYFRTAFTLMPESDRKAAAQDAIDKDLNFRRPVRDYIASLAAKGYANDETGFLRAMANRLEQLISTDQPISENQLLYMMWRDAKRYPKQDVLSLAQDISLRKRLGIGEFVNQFPGQAEAVEQQAEKNVDVADKARSEERKEAIREVKEGKAPYEAINRAMGAQRQYDRATVDGVVDLAKQMIKEGNINGVTAREMARLMTIIKSTNGRRPETVKNCCKQLLDFMVDHTLQTEEDLLTQMLKVKAAKVKAPGVDVQAKLDVRAQGIINTFKEYMGRDESDIREAIDERMDKLSDDRTSETRKEELQAELDGLSLALQYCTEIAQNEAENTGIRDGLKAARADYKDLPEEEQKRFAKALQEQTEASYDMIRKNKIDRVNAYRELRAALGEAIAEGAERAKTFLEKERERVAQIHHEANSDMQGVDDDPIEPKVKSIGKLINNGVARLLTSPLATFDQMLRMLGRKHPNGQGYLWNRYMGQLRDANDNEKLGLDKANDELNAKVQEIFGDKTMTWNDLYNLEKGMGKATIRFFNANGKWVEQELSAGNLLYIYMVDKMPDGRMKLRQMGINEDDVRAIRDGLDPRFIRLADWIQEEFLTKLRDKYNQVHQRLFGTSMAAIENYFPLRILGGVIREEIDLSNPDSNVLPSAMTGSIIKRTVNRKQLDITGTDAFSLVIEHIQEMEHWAAFAELNRDLGTLLSYKRFQNQMKHMTTIYGAGRELWGRFKNTAILAAHEYRPARTPLDTAAINLAKGVSTAKISFRAYTAIKQILSWPAFLADANIVQLAKYTAPWNWRSNWKWAMENLPNFKKRVESRTVGNEKLDPDELDSKFWGTEFAKWIGRNGMSMNAFVDALTVSIGARAMYETKKAQYLSEGYDEARADKKARFDATTLFNETQQSSEKEFMSTMQADRTVVSVALSVYRNSSFGYQRQLHSALRTLGRLAKKGYKQESIEYMTKQLVRDGLSEDQARDAAEKRYSKALGQAAVRAAVFGFIVEFAWNLGANAIYLLFGDDPDEKKQMLEEDAMKALSGGMVEGLAGGSIISDLLSKFEQGESVYGYDMNTLPIMQDVKNTIAHFGTDPVSAANELVFLGLQIGLGTNPQTFSDAIVAIIDACNGDFETAKEVELLIMRILQVPQSQLDQLMIDEIDMTAGDAKKLSYEEVAQRYVDYKMMRNAPLTGIAYPEELRAKREKSHKTTFKKKYNQRMKLKEQE